MRQQQQFLCEWLRGEAVHSFAPHVFLPRRPATGKPHAPATLEKKSPAGATNTAGLFEKRCK